MPAGEAVGVAAHFNRDGHAVAPCPYCATRHKYEMHPSDLPREVRARCGRGVLLLHTEGAHVAAVE